MTDMDQLLRDHAERWAARQPAPPPLDAPQPRAGHRARTLAVVAAVVIACLLAVGVALVSGSRSGDNGAATVDPAVRVKLEQVLHRMVDLPKNTTTSAYAVRTTLRHAETLIQASGSDANAAVWVIEARGHFVCVMCSRPPGVPDPTSSAFLVVVDAKTYDIRICGPEKKAHDLSRLGRVVTLIAPR